jgi:VanZ family protein
MRPAHWLPPVVWMGVILWLGSGDFSATETSLILGPFLFWLFPLATPAEIAAWHGGLRKLAHLTVYAILALLWYRGLARDGRISAGRSALIALAISLAWAGVDEIRQALVPSRTGTVRDVAIDAAGASAALAVRHLGWRGVDAFASLLLWLAAAGGALMIALNLAAGVGSGLLWLTTPAAWLLLLLRRSGRARPPS